VWLDPRVRSAGARRTPAATGTIIPGRGARSARAPRRRWPESSCRDGVRGRDARTAVRATWHRGPGAMAGWSIGEVPWNSTSWRSRSPRT
jgi:hypothetical protein